MNLGPPDGEGEGFGESIPFHLEVDHRSDGPPDGVPGHIDSPVPSVDSLDFDDLIPHDEAGLVRRCPAEHRRNRDPFVELGDLDPDPCVVPRIALLERTQLIWCEHRGVGIVEPLDQAVQGHLPERRIAERGLVPGQDVLEGLHEDLALLVGSRPDGGIGNLGFSRCPEA